MTRSEREAFVNSLWSLHEDLTSEATSDDLNPGRLMRLTALGVDQCLVGIAALLEDLNEEEGDDLSRSD